MSNPLNKVAEIMKNDRSCIVREILTIIVVGRVA